MINFFSALGTEALFEILKQSGDATAIYTGYELNIQFVNDAMLKIWGKDSSVYGKRFEDALPEMEGQPFTDLLKNVWTSREVFEAKQTPATLEIDDTMVTSYFDFIYKPIMNRDGEIYCILHTAVDVTEKVITWKKLEENEMLLQELNEELTAINEELQTGNEELASLNKEFSSTNKQLEISNKHLETRNNELDYLNKTITDLNKKLSDSEISFGNLISQSPVAMMLLKGDDLKVTKINRSMIELIGKDPEIVGKPIFEEMPELKGQLSADMLIDTYRTGQSHSSYSNPVHLMRNGTLEKGFFNFTYTPFIEDGKVTGVIDMAVEVTVQETAIQQRDNIISEKTSLEETLKVSEQRLQGILETMAEGVGVTDAGGQLIYANPMAQQILGLEESKIKERTYDDPQWQNLRLDGTALPPEEHPMSIMMSTGKAVYDYEIGVQPPDRDRFYISINAAPIFDQAGNITGGIGTFMDVTTRRMITQGKDDFISIASHELKTPVTALKATLQLLQRSHEKLPVEVRGRLLDQSIISLDKLSRLITDLLDSGRMEQGQVKLQKQSFNISELFDNCCSGFAQHSQHQIIFDGDLDEVIDADDQQIGQVLVNFITNAIKYAPDTEKIVVYAKKSNAHEIRISVVDQGPGIPKEKLGHLFERYYRTNYEGQKFTGLGLGLYISAQIIKNHGGKIGAESEVGSGSEFWFTLPINHQ